MINPLEVETEYDEIIRSHVKRMKIKWCKKLKNLRLHNHIIVRVITVCVYVN